MHTFESILTRRAVKHYQADFVIPEADEQKLFDLARHSPTSYNIQNWRFVIVKDPVLREKIAKASWEQGQVTEASLLVLLCADLHAWNKDPARYWESAPPEVRDYLVSSIKSFYNGQDQIQRDEAMRSVGIAAQTLMLAAKAMGYDTCPMIGFDPVAVGKLINLPIDHVIGMMLTIGKAAKPAQPKGGFLPMDEIVVKDHFSLLSQR